MTKAPISTFANEVIMGKSLQRIRWIASYPKSGNTLLRFLLSSYLNGGILDINAPHGVLNQDTQFWHYQAVSPFPLAEMTVFAKMLLRPAALLHMVASSPEAYPFFVKTHFPNGAMVGVESIPDMLTENAIYIVRDPRDIAISMAEHFSKPIDEIIHVMGDESHRVNLNGVTHSLSTWSIHVKSWKESNKPTLIIRYEDLVDNMKDIFTKILIFEGFEIDDGVLAKCVELCSLENVRAQEDERGFRERYSDGSFFKRGTYGGWKDVLSAEQAAKIESDHGDMMLELGYEPGERAKAA